MLLQICQNPEPFTFCRCMRYWGPPAPLRSPADRSCRRGAAPTGPRATRRAAPWPLCRVFIYFLFSFHSRQGSEQSPPQKNYNICIEKFSLIERVVFLFVILKFLPLLRTSDELNINPENPNKNAVLEKILNQYNLKCLIETLPMHWCTKVHVSLNDPVVQFHFSHRPHGLFSRKFFVGWEKESCLQTTSLTPNTPTHPPTHEP